MRVELKKRVLRKRCRSLWQKYAPAICYALVVGGMVSLIIAVNEHFNFFAPGVENIMRWVFAPFFSALATFAAVRHSQKPFITPEFMVLFIEWLEERKRKAETEDNN